MALGGIFAYDSVGVWAVSRRRHAQLVGLGERQLQDFESGRGRGFCSKSSILARGDVARLRFKFPFIRIFSAGVGVLFVFDLVTKGHGESLAVVSLLLGLAYLFVGHVSNKPSTFWLHLAAGLLIGIPIIYWCNTSTFDFAVLAFMSLVYVVWAYWTKRSSWAVFGTIGFFIVAEYFVAKAVEDTTQAAAFNGGSPVVGPLVRPARDRPSRILARSPRDGRQAEEG